MRDRTRAVGSLAVLFLALQVAGGIASGHYPSEPPPSFYIAIEITAVCLWVVMLVFTVRWAWLPLVVWHGYQTAMSGIGLLELIGVSGLALADITMLIVLFLVPAVPLLALVSDPPWKWKWEVGKNTVA